MPRRRLKSLLLFVALLVGGVALYMGYRLVHILNGIPDAYARWDVGDVILDYMSKHDNQWPSGWEELRPSFVACASIGGRMRGGLSLEDLRNRLEIDWNASPQNVLTQHAPFNAIVIKSGNQTTWAAAEPNEMVIQYLQKHTSSQTGATRPSKSK